MYCSKRKCPADCSDEACPPAKKAKFIPFREKERPRMTRPSKRKCAVDWSDAACPPAKKAKLIPFREEERPLMTRSSKRKCRVDWSDAACPPAKKAKLNPRGDEQRPHLRRQGPVERREQLAGRSLKRHCPPDWQPDDAPTPAKQARLSPASEKQGEEGDAPTPGEPAQAECGASSRSTSEAGQGAAGSEDDEDESDDEEDAVTVTVPSNEDIARLGQEVRWKHLSVLVTGVKFSFPRSRLLQVFRSVGPLRLEHMPRHRRQRRDSHRGFAVLTYRSAHHTNVALGEARDLLARAGCHGVYTCRLGNHTGYAAFCKGIDVAQVMSDAPPVEKAAEERHHVTAPLSHTPQQDADERAASSEPGPDRSQAVRVVVQLCLPRAAAAAARTQEEKRVVTVSSVWDRLGEKVEGAGQAGGKKGSVWSRLEGRGPGQAGRTGVRSRLQGRGCGAAPR